MNIEVKPLQEEHLEMLMHWRMNPGITKYMFTDPDLTMAQQLQWYNKVKNSESYKYWVIYLNNDPIGAIYLTDIDYKNQRCSWGYYIAEKKYRSFQLAVSLECSLYQYIFEEMHLQKTYSGMLENNLEVLRLHELCGGKLEGVLRKHILKKGVFYDVYMYSILSQEWDEVKNDIKYQFIKFN